MSDADIADKGAVTGGGVMEPAGQVGLVVVHAATHWVIFTLLEAEAQGVLALQRCSSHMEPAITYDEKGYCVLCPYKDRLQKVTEIRFK